MKNKNTRLVYSTEQGSVCPTCKKHLDRCRCKQTKDIPEGDGIVRIGRSTKGRKGKGVTTVSGIAADASELKQMAATLKKKCGTGGTVKNGVIEIQGDHRDLLMTQLQALGYTVRKSGG